MMPLTSKASSSAVLILLLLLASAARSDDDEEEEEGEEVLDSDDGCALILPHTSSACITYDDVNTAFSAATESVGLPPVKGDKFSAEDIDSLGNVMQETSRYLAKQHGLNKDGISGGLKLIDTTKTHINNYCPPFLKAAKCEIERYRSIGGVCNNIEHPYWGIANHVHHRFVKPDFGDGISAPRLSVTGKAMPSARLVSATVHRDLGFHDHAVTIMLVAWGQFIDHDMTLTGETRDLTTGRTPKCCEGVDHPNCMPIKIPPNDPFFSKHEQKCMNFARSLSGLRPYCKLGTRDSFNQVSSVLDGGTVYADGEEAAKNLRANKGGLLKMLPVFDEYDMKPLLPLKLEGPNEGCIRPSEDVYCFLAGDGRVNEQTVLGLVHLIFVREHNRIATELAHVNPHWNDETLYQETRHIIAALCQHITYNEFLPMVLGKEVMKRHGLLLNKDGYWDGYDPHVNPAIDNGFAAAAFRFGHTLLPSTIERWSKTHRYVGSQRLSEMLQQPYDLYKAGWADAFLLGMANQVAQAYDDGITQEVTNHLFQEPGKQFGLDLAALNMQRGREHGVPSYNRWRELCGFPVIHDWSDLLGIMSNSTVGGYAKVYATPDDMDIWSAGVSEKPLQGSLMGPTFACILGKQFHNLRHGDRFWYENGGWPSSFTLEQLQDIRKIKLARIVCDNSDHIETMQVFSMVLPDHEINPRVPCNSGILPKLNLQKWRDKKKHHHDHGEEEEASSASEDQPF